jgi:hypothetical protein
VILTPKQIEIKEFAQRVERLCDYLLGQVKPENSGDKDILVIKDLKEDAADLQFKENELIEIKFNGLDNFMKGLSKEST